MRGAKGCTKDGDIIVSNPQQWDFHFGYQQGRRIIRERGITYARGYPRQVPKFGNRYVVAGYTTALARTVAA